MLFNEDLLQFTWRFGLFDSAELRTGSGETIEILSAGLLNTNSGPDFENARIRIQGTLWVGNVEIHLRSSDWTKHRHFSDKMYDSVILHVVYDHDETVYRTDGTSIPTLILRGRVAEEVISGYERLMRNMNWIPCENQLPELDPLLINSWLCRMMVEKLELKNTAIQELLTEYKGNWDDVFYILLARNFGFKINSVPFELLARSLPQRILFKHKDKSKQLEALFFGQAGLLGAKPADEYQHELSSEFRFLKRKYRLRPIDSFLWKFSRLRPHNFPTLRIAQFAALIVKSSHLFSKAIEIESTQEAVNLFTDLPVNGYWKTHYRFSKVSGNLSPQIGKESIHNILENTLAPFLFAWGKSSGNEIYIRRAVKLMENLPPETNEIIRRFKEIGINPENAGSSQALIHLKKFYCDKKKCLNCGIGAKLINRGV